jgi:hypothetical protein
MKYLSIVIVMFFVLYGCKSTQEKINVIPFVKMSFDISEEGKPINIVVLDAQPDTSNKLNAIAALSKWVYKPKLVDGVAVLQKDLKVQLEF